MGDITLKIRGMFGEHCERAIKDSISHIPGVANVKVKQREGTISFYYMDDAALLAVKDAISDAGYDVIG